MGQTKINNNNNQNIEGMIKGWINVMLVTIGQFDSIEIFPICTQQFSYFGIQYI